MKYKNLKKKARLNLKHNYWHSVAIVFFVSIIVGNFSISDFHQYESNLAIIKVPIISSVNKQNFRIINETINGVQKITQDIKEYKPERGILATFFNNITASESFIFGFLNSINQLVFKNRIWLSITLFLGAILSFIHYFFVANIFVVGENRFFLESTNHKRTPFNRILLPFRTGHYFNACKIMMKKTCYNWLWWLTIVGGIIKHYEYAMIPYILAENPGISSKDAFHLSKEMMKQHKFELFILDFSFLFWYILDIITFHISATIYSSPLRKYCLAHFYIKVRGEIKESEINASELLCDDELLNQGNLYPSQNYMYKEKKRKFIKNTDYQKNYSITSLILMFFSASLIGWLWEVSFHYIQYGSLVNRGSLYGPWLPIYGWGALVLLVVLKKYRKDPFKTFILAIVLCGVIEYGTSLYLEIFNHAAYWDYEGFFMNIHGRVCLEGLMAFGIGGCAFIYFGAPFLENIYIKINNKIKIVLCILLALLYIGDSLYSGHHPHTGSGISKDLYAKEITEITL